VSRAEQDGGVGGRGIDRAHRLNPSAERAPRLTPPLRADQHLDQRPMGGLVVLVHAQQPDQQGGRLIEATSLPMQAGELPQSLDPSGASLLA
jgi:hypothetical protein